MNAKAKPNLLLYSPNYAETRNEFAMPISATKRQGNTCAKVKAVANRF